jgi:hypothetical protein
MYVLRTSWSLSLSCSHKREILKRISTDDVNWIHLAWDMDRCRAVAKVVMIVRVEWYARDFSAGWETGSVTNMTVTPWSWIVSPVMSNLDSPSGQTFQLGNVLFLFVCLTTLSVARTVQHRMPGWSVRNELLGMWKETVLVLVEVLHQTSPEWQWCLRHEIWLHSSDCCVIKWL